MIKAASPISKNNHAPNKNKIAEISGIHHRFLIFFPAMTPMKIENIGFIAKNKNKQAAIPASPFTKVIVSQGKASITTAEIAIQKITLLLTAYKYLHPYDYTCDIQNKKQPLKEYR